MTSVSEITPEVKFCVRYLLEHGINAANFGKVVLSLKSTDKRFTLAEVKDTHKDFFTRLAAELRELWPSGNKDGKWPWRESVPNLARRLEVLWSERMEGKDYTVEQCVLAARKYLARFDEDRTYMKLLKYFIMKQEPIVKENGRLTYINKSDLADILESEADQLREEAEWENIMSSVSDDNGEII